MIILTLSDKLNVREIAVLNITIYFSSPLAITLKKWGDKTDEITSMDFSIEIILRLYLLDKIILPKQHATSFRE